MKRLKNKLQSQSGASVIIALAFFLLCVTVGAVVLTSATANTGRLAQMRREQQDYLTVSSAARLLREALSGQVFRETIVTVSALGSSTSNTTHASPGSALAAALENDAITLCKGNRPAARALTVSAGGLEAVNAVLQMNGDFSVTVTLSVGDDGRCPLTITVPADEDHPSPTVHRVDISYPTGEVDEQGQAIWDFYTETTETDVRTVTWGGGVIMKGGAEP